MPTRPPSFRPAGHQTAAQRKADLDRNRGSASKRGYDRDWQRLSKAFLRVHPLCQCPDCDEGRKRLTPANTVDHIKSIRERPDLRLEWSNLRAMHKNCHDRHTAKQQGFAKGKRQG